MEVKKNTSSIFEEVLIDVLAEFDGVVSSDWIDENKEIYRNLLRSDLEILVKIKNIIKQKFNLPILKLFNIFSN